MNYARVLLGGLVAGLVLNIGEFIFNDFVVSEQLKTYLSSHNFQDPGGSFIAVAVILTFCLGIVMVMLYAMIRACNGPGPKTAICTALIVWFCVCVYTGVINGILFAVPMNLMLLALVWCLIEYCLAALAGAWLYKEA